LIELSPEILIGDEGKLNFIHSLAGTSPAKRKESPIKTAAWTQKKINEQALVKVIYRDCFKKIRLS